MRIKLLAFVALLLGASVWAVSPDELVLYWLGKTPAPAPAVETVGEGLDYQAAFVKALVPIAGAPVGYKVGLTSKAVQERFGVDHPLRGVLLERMLLESGAVVPARFGAVPIAEADLIVRVKDAGVNQARTPEEVLEHLDAVVPFIELPDLMLKKGEPLTGATITAINVGARLGVLGRPIPVEASPEFARALAEMQVYVSVDDALVMKVPGKAILGHPLNAVIWLAQDLARRGEALKPGDLVSLGSLGKPLRPQAGQTLWVGYSFGRWGGEVKVSFE
ncbi:2-keto-4-pentenoate hydratase [Deinococcota bacterium DY0809b]